MTEHDPNEQLASSLFEAARSERPDERVRARTKALATTASRGIQEVEARGGARSFTPQAWAAACIALIGIVWLVANLDRSEPERAPAFVVTPEPSEPAAAAPAAVRPESAPQPERVAPAQPTQPPLRKLAPKAPAPETPATSAPKPAPSLAEEIALLDGAREALAANDGARAIALVDRYEHELVGTRMRAEAELLRIEALAQRGERARAAELARRFVAQHAGNPLAERARAFVTIEEAPQGELQ